MKITLWVFVVAAAVMLMLAIPKGNFEAETATSTGESVLAPQKPPLADFIRDFLESKDSPLAPETDFLMQQKHWRLLIAISAIESQYCKRQLGNNCWGVGGDSAYRSYATVRDAITDANNLIEHWQERGRWLTVDDMNCHYVVPCNPNWVIVVNKNLSIIESYERESSR